MGRHYSLHSGSTALAEDEKSVEQSIILTGLGAYVHAHFHASRVIDLRHAVTQDCMAMSKPSMLHRTTLQKFILMTS